MPNPIAKGGIGLPPPKGTPIGRDADALLAAIANAVVRIEPSESYVLIDGSESHVGLEAI